MQSNSTPLDEARAVFRELLALAESRGGDLESYEAACSSHLMALGRAMVRHRLEALTPKDEFVEDGTRWRVAVRSRLGVMTSFGRVDVERPLFRRRRTGPTRCVVKERARLMAGFWTTRAAKLGAMAIAEMPMERAEQFFAEAGYMPVSRSSLLRLGGWLSDLWESERDSHEQTIREATEVPRDAATVAVSLDGVMVLMTDSDKGKKKANARARGYPDKGPLGWREASVGVISFYDAEGERLETRRYGRMPEADKATTKSWLRAELTHIRSVRPDLTVVAIADGAANNWSFLSELDADHEVVDFFHAAEHLHRHVSKANGASTIETQQKLRNMRRRLLEHPGGARAVRAELKRLRAAAGTAPPSTIKKRGRRQPTFFERHRERMNFAALREAKLPIGSGVTESTCKLTICDRLRRTGMRWSERGGQAVTTLRAHIVSQRFDSAWGVLDQANRKRLAA